MELQTIEDTYFDFPERSSKEEIETDIQRFKNNPLVTQLLEGYPNLAVILNWNRHIVAYNSKASEILQESLDGEIYGQRLGEALRCVHAYDMPAGCGTSKFCAECGAGKASKLIRESLVSCTDECRITTNVNNCETSLNLKINSSILIINGDIYTVFAIENIADLKRKEVLERIFFHDVLNTATSIKGITDLLPTVEDTDEFKVFSGMLEVSANQLVQEIQVQRDLMDAENGRLSVNPIEININLILEKTYNLYADHDLARDKNISYNSTDENATIETDSIYLVRSLGNLVKNALEAIGTGDTVTINADVVGDSVYFNIKNDGVIPKDVQLQIFQRAFSTKKEAGRGIGTYSVKLLIENYLGGKAYFTSNKMLQTIFTIELPKVFNQQNDNT